MERGSTEKKRSFYGFFGFLYVSLFFCISLWTVLSSHIGAWGRSSEGAAERPGTSSPLLVPEPDGDVKASEYRRTKPNVAKRRGLRGARTPIAAAAPNSAPTVVNVSSSAHRTGSSWHSFVEDCVIGVCLVVWLFSYWSLIRSELHKSFSILAATKKKHPPRGSNP